MKKYSDFVLHSEFTLYKKGSEERAASGYFILDVENPPTVNQLSLANLMSNNIIHGEVDTLLNKRLRLRLQDYPFMMEEGSSHCLVDVASLPEKSDEIREKINFYIPSEDEPTLHRRVNLGAFLLEEEKRAITENALNSSALSEYKGEKVVILEENAGWGGIEKYDVGIVKSDGYIQFPNREYEWHIFGGQGRAFLPYSQVREVTDLFERLEGRSLVFKEIRGMDFRKEWLEFIPRSQDLIEAGVYFKLDESGY